MKKRLISFVSLMLVAVLTLSMACMVQAADTQTLNLGATTSLAGVPDCEGTIAITVEYTSDMDAYWGVGSLVDADWANLDGFSISSPNAQMTGDVVTVEFDIQEVKAAAATNINVWSATIVKVEVIVPASMTEFSYGTANRLQLDPFTEGEIVVTVEYTSDMDAYWGVGSLTDADWNNLDGYSISSPEAQVTGDTVTVRFDLAAAKAAGATYVNAWSCSIVDVSVVLPADTPSYEDGFGAELAGYTVSLEGNIGVNFHMELAEEVASSETAFFRMTYTNAAGTDVVTDVYVKDAETKTIGDKTYYVFKCGVPVKDMTTTISAQLHVGEETGTLYEYTVKEYADYILASDDYDANTKALVKAMLNFGGYAQTYFDHNTDNMANADLDAADKALPETVTIDADEAAVLNTDALPEGLSYYGTSILLKSNTVLRHYFTVEEGYDIADYTISAGWTGETTSTVNVKDDYYYIDVEGIDAVNLNSSPLLTVNGADIVEWYSCLSYAKAVLEGDSYSADFQNLMKAMYVYYEAAMNMGN